MHLCKLFFEEKPSQCHPLEDFCAGRILPLVEWRTRKLETKPTQEKMKRNSLLERRSVESLAVSVCGILERLIDVDSF
jgi:hypothetical protein